MLQVICQIKMKPTMADGASHLLTEVMALDEVCFTRLERGEVQKTIEINGYFAHPENLIIAMLGQLYDFTFRN